MSMKAAAICGGAIGIVLTIAGLILAGAGHGSNVPTLVFFAPLVVLAPFAPVLGETVIGFAFLVGGPLLYVGYASLLVWAKRRNKGPKMLLILVVFHLGAALISGWCYPEAWDYKLLKKTYEIDPLYFVLAFLPFPLAIVVSVFFVLKTRGSQNEPPRCRKCGYNLTGNTSGVCPECGKQVQANRSKSRESIRSDAKHKARA